METTKSTMTRIQRNSNARSGHKTPRGDLRKQLRRWLKTMLLVPTATTLLSASALAQVPTGGNVVAGTATIANAAGNMDVNATTARAIVNWDSFSIGAGNTANFNLPDANSAILNRVTGTDLSTIAGTLNSNGNVYLVNPNGIMVGSTVVINTNGFTASVFDIGNDAFMAGGPLSFSGDSTASIINNGVINTGAGGAHLIANQITNNGTIESTGGNITLSGGGEVTLSGGVSYVQPSMETLASGISPTAGLIQNNGVIRATGAATTGGEIYLVNPNGEILHDGTIAATRVAQASSLSDQVGQASTLSDTDAGGLVASSTTGESSDDRLEAYPTVGGSIMLEADEITLTSDSTIEATGTHGGGEVLVGGDWEGGKEEPEFAKNLADPSSDAFHARRDVMTQATKVLMESGAVIDASATAQGDGGKIVLWSDITNADSLTEVFGTLLAKAGTLFGDGGYIETSGASIDTAGITAIATAPAGVGGLWLIDPYNYTIDATAASNIVSSLNTGTSVTVSTDDSNASYGATGNSGSTGRIDLLADIVVGAMSGGANLQFFSGNFVGEGATIDATQNSNTMPLNVVIRATNESENSSISLPTIRTNGGLIWAGGTGVYGTTRGNLRVLGDLDTRGISAGSGNSIDLRGGLTQGRNLFIGDYTDKGSFQINTGSGDFSVISGNAIIFYGSANVVTDGGDVEFISNAFGGLAGGIGSGSEFDDANVSIATGGGNITFGGGNPSGTSFAKANVNEDRYNAGGGIDFSGTLTLSSAGGDISIRGESSPGLGHSAGVRFASDTSIDSGDGNLLIHGVAQDSNFDNFGIYAGDNNSVALTSSSTDINAITLIGDARLSGGAIHSGIEFSGLDLSIVATGAGGGITVEGYRSEFDDTAVSMHGGEILASNGPISISGFRSTDGESARVSLWSALHIGAKAGSAVTSSSSNITISDDVAAAGATVNTTGDVSLLSIGDSFLDSVGASLAIDNARNVTIGKTTNTSEISIENNINFTGDLNVYGGKTEVGFDVDVVGSAGATAAFHASAEEENNIYGRITVGSLLFTGQGEFEAYWDSNNVGTLASSTDGEINFVNTGALTIGQVGSTEGIQSQGTINIETLTGNLTIAKNVTTTLDSSAAIRLIAGSDSAAGTSTGGNILVIGGATVSAGTNGRATLYSGSVAGSTGLTDLVGHGSGRFRYNSNGFSHNFTKALGTGVHAIYREQPSLSGSFTESFVYGEGVYGEGVNGDRLALNVSNAQYSTSGHLRAGNYTASFVSGTGADLGYGSVIGSGTVEITQRDVTVQNLNVADRLYDGTRVALVDHSGVNFDNIIANDLLTAAGTTGEFDAKEIGNDRVVTLSGTTYGGADVGNYNITDQTQTTATINARPITVSGITVNDKVYDGHTTSTVDLSGVVFGNIVDGETLTIADTIGTFADKNVGVDKLVTLSGSTYGGADVGNYSFTDQPSTTATITRLDSVTWTGGNSGNWSDPNNWAGGAIPDLSNVANVIIPDGTTVTYTDLGQAVNVDSLSGGSLRANGGTLNLAGNLNVDTLVVGFADVNVGGNLDVTSSFSQLSHLEVGGTATIHQDAGNLQVALLDAGAAKFSTSDGDLIFSNVNISGDLTATAKGGDIRQWNGGALRVDGKTILKSDNDITLAANNAMNDFRGPVCGSGENVELSDVAGGLVLGEISVGNDLKLTTSHGGITQTDNSTIDVGGFSDFDCDGDCTLDGPNNRLLGAISVVANNFSLVQAAEELLCGDIDIVGNFSAVTDGKITQTKDSSVKVRGTAKLFAPTVLLPNATNEFAKVIYTSTTAIINAAGPFEECLLGSSGENVLDTFTRYEGPTQQPTGGSPFGGMFASQQSTLPPSIRPAAELISPLAQIGNFYAKSAGGETYVGTKTSDSPRDID